MNADAEADEATGSPEADARSGAGDRRGIDDLQLATLGGQSDAAGVLCGMTTKDEVDKRRDEARRKRVANGMDPKAFDKACSAGYQRTVERFKADPARGKDGCRQLEALGKALGEQLNKPAR